MPEKTWEIPPGMRDFLPGDAREKRALEDKWVELFTAWGYQEVLTPTVEYLPSLTVDSGDEIRDRLFQFFDHQGRILALRPEMTIPIARLVATRLTRWSLPLRLYYAANVFRYAEPQAGRQREIFQAGVEVIGAPGPVADAEIVALAVEALRQAGLTDFQISLGQIEVFNGLMEELPLAGEHKARVRQLVAKKDFVGLRELLAATGLPAAQADLLLHLPTLHGGPEVLTQAACLAVNQRAAAGLENLSQVYAALQAFGVEAFVALDLGVLRGFDYYTGVVFEGYTFGVGFPICGGGRYDRLLARMGYDCPATGFAIGLDRVLLALSRLRQPVAAPVADVLVGGVDLAQVIAIARELRAAGLVVETDLLGRDRAGLVAGATARGIKTVRFAAGAAGEMGAE
ncbi:MAG: ATP phosphoribosyltransferase regulatory subunit [Heliobacteriaceae bacterium]|nr:ATP phosphoribosyltransferase regulatory subunit [Heliobacteriaceae bacterium]